MTAEGVVGQPIELPQRTFTVTRADLVAYAAASGDDNPIHQDESVALAVGLPGVIAHGMFTLALAARYVDEWVGHVGGIAEIGAKFVKPVVVSPEGAELVLNGVAKDVDGVRRIDLVATCAGVKVLGACRVRLHG